MAVVRAPQREDYYAGGESYCEWSRVCQLSFAKLPSGVSAFEISDNPGAKIKGLNGMTQRCIWSKTPEWSLGEEQRMHP